MEKTKHTFENIQEEISSMLSISDDELTDEQRATMDAYLEELAEQEAAKIDGFAQFVRLETARAENLKEESKRLAARAKAAISRIEYLRGKYAQIMLQHGLKKAQGNVYSITLGKSERVEVPAYAGNLPPEFVKVEEVREPNKAAIKEALKEGRDIPGCSIKTVYRVQVR